MGGMLERSNFKKLLVLSVAVLPILRYVSLPKFVSGWALLTKASSVGNKITRPLPFWQQY